MVKRYTTKIHDVLEFVQLRPKQLSSRSVVALENYIYGYMVLGKWGYVNRNLIYNKGDADLGEFFFWLQGIPNVPLKPGPPFAQFLLEKCKGDDERAFNMFFELWAEFKRIVEERGWVISPNTRNF